MYVETDEIFVIRFIFLDSIDISQIKCMVSIGITMCQKLIIKCNYKIQFHSKHIVEVISGCLFDPFRLIVTFHIETSHLICRENQMTGFYMKCNAGLNWVNGKFVTNFSSVFANVGKAVFTCSKSVIETIIYEICSKLTLKTLERYHLLTLNRFHTLF